MKKILFKIVFVLLTSFFLILAYSLKGQGHLRIEINTLQKEESIELVDPKYFFLDGQSFELLAWARIFLEAQGEGLLLRDELGQVLAQGQKLIIPAQGPAIKVLAREYWGEIEITSHKGLLDIINIIALEDYVACVLGEEMPLTWPREALRAQSILIRSFALANQGQKANFDLCSSSHCQVYKGVPLYWQEAQELAFSTRNLVLVEGGKLQAGFYHSTCGGYLAREENIWGNLILEERACQWEGESLCSSSPYFTWQREMKFETWANLCQDLTGLDPLFFPLEFTYSPQGRITAFTCGGQSYPFLRLWSRLTQEYGWGFWPSNCFQLERLDDLIIFKGRGLGHGVGLCQWGAKRLAQLAFNYQEILSFYYPQARILAYDELTSQGREESE